MRHSFLVPFVLPSSMLLSLYPFLLPVLQQSPSMRFAVALLKSSVADPDIGSGAFLAPGSGIGFFSAQISDSGSQIDIFEQSDNFWIKRTTYTSS